MQWEVTREDAELHRIPQKSDLRRFRRIKMILGLVCHVGEEEDVNLYTDDVSLSGIKFTSSVQLKKGGEIEVEIPVGHGKYQKVKGTVVWCRQGVISGFDGAIDFYNIDDETAKSWLKFIERNAERD